MDRSERRQDVEKTLWMLSAWQVEQTDVDTVMAKVDAYAAAPGTEPQPAHPTTFDDLPEDERRRIVDSGVKACADSYAQGVVAGREKAAADAAERPSAGLIPFPASPEPGRAYEAADGTLWLCLGAAQKMGPVPSPAAVIIPAQRVAPEGMRTCRVCRTIKVLATDFRSTERGPEGFRSECRRCEAAAKVRRRTSQKAS